MPLPRDGLGHQALPAALDAHQQNAPRLGQPVCARLVAERSYALSEPVLQHIHAPDVRQIRVEAVILQQARFSNDLPFFRYHGLNVLSIQHRVAHDSLRKRIFGFLQRQPLSRFNQRVAVLWPQLDLKLACGTRAPNGIVQEPAQFLVGGQGEIEDGHVFFQLAWKRQHGRQKDEGLAGRRERAAQVANLPDHLRRLEVRMKIFQDIDGRAILLQHLIQLLQRIAGARSAAQAPFPMNTAQTVCYGPFIQGFPLAFSQTHENAQRAVFLPRHNIEQRVARPDEPVQFFAEPVVLHV